MKICVRKKELKKGKVGKKNWSIFKKIPKSLRKWRKMSKNVKKKS